MCVELFFESSICSFLSYFLDDLLGNIFFHLTFNTDAFPYQRARFGEGTGPIFLDDVTCSGTESSLLDCTHSGIGVHDCSHHEDASVRCQGIKIIIICNSFDFGRYLSDR